MGGRGASEYGNIPMVRIWNRHNVHKKYIGIRKYEIGSGRKLFITFELKVIKHEEREAQFYADCFYIVSSLPKQRAAPVAHKVVWPCPVLNVDSLVRRQELNSLLFLKSQPTLPVRDVTHIPWSNSYLGFLFWHLWMTHPLRVLVNTCINVAPN